ncbi:MAG: hypothetical protein U9N02_06730 [Campylobacterota bacterium]|nr:hypothetical protein [Campylobacterota bacterium]
MCNFNKQDSDTKALIHLFMKKSADALGGTNFLLNLIETMKKNRPNALLLKEKKVKSNEATIEWNKVIFKDKFEILEDAIRSHKSEENQDFNLLDIENEKKRKKVLNMIKTLAPIEFTIAPKDSSENGGFSFKVFDSVDNDFVKVNPIFVAMFFCSVDFTKKALKYEI